MIVLVVDNDENFREQLSLMLIEAGLNVAEASSAEAALRVVDEEKEPFLLLSDINLGAGMSGFDLAEEARRRRPRASVVLMGGSHNNPEPVHSAKPEPRHPLQG